MWTQDFYRSLIKEKKISNWFLFHISNYPRTTLVTPSQIKLRLRQLLIEISASSEFSKTGFYITDLVMFICKCSFLDFQMQSLFLHVSVPYKAHISGLPFSSLTDPLY